MKNCLTCKWIPIKDLLNGFVCRNIGALDNLPKGMAFIRKHITVEHNGEPYIRNEDGSVEPTANCPAWQEKETNA